MRIWALPVVVMTMIMAMALGGCGQKGPLYRENPEASSGPAEESSSAGQQNESLNQKGSGAE